MSTQNNKADQEVKNSEKKHQSLTGKLKESVQEVKDYLSDRTKNSPQATVAPENEAMVASMAQRTEKSEDLPNKGEIKQNK